MIDYSAPKDFHIGNFASVGAVLGSHGRSGSGYTRRQSVCGGVPELGLVPCPCPQRARRPACLCKARSLPSFGRLFDFLRNANPGLQGGDDNQWVWEWKFQQDVRALLAHFIIFSALDIRKGQLRNDAKLGRPKATGTLAPRQRWSCVSCPSAFNCQNK